MVGEIEGHTPLRLISASTQRQGVSPFNPEGQPAKPLRGAVARTPPTLTEADFYRLLRREVQGRQTEMMQITSEVIHQTYLSEMQKAFQKYSLALPFGEMTPDFQKHLQSNLTNLGLNIFNAPAYVLVESTLAYQNGFKGLTHLKERLDHEGNFMISSWAARQLMFQGQESSYRVEGSALDCQSYDQFDLSFLVLTAINPISAARLSNYSLLSNRHI